MKIDKIIHSEGNNVYLTVDIFTLCSYVKQFDSSLVKDFQHMYHNYMGLFNAVWKISVCIDKVAFAYYQLVKGDIDIFRFSHSARTDIEFFHICLRSSLDYLVKLIAAFTGIKKASFSNLRKDIEVHRELLGDELSTLIIDAQWYETFNDIRNGLIHSGADVTVFHTVGEGIKFQITQKNVSKPEVFVFERYAVEYLSHYFELLDEVGRILRNKVANGVPMSPLRISGQGISVFNAWRT